MGQAGKQKQKSSLFFEKKHNRQSPVSYLTCSAKQMLFQLPIHHQNKGKEVCFYSAISTYILLRYLLSVFVSSYIKIF